MNLVFKRIDSASSSWSASSAFQEGCSPGREA
jgi:hypothetical protein